MATDRERLFGNDLLLLDTLSGFDLVAGARRDLALARGNTNIEQALVLRLRVRRGELAALGWPTYGSRIHELIGQPNLKRTQVMLMAFAREAIEQDPRVEEVTSVAVVPIPGERDTVRLDLEITLISQQTPLNLVVDVGLGGPG
jgi:phage baseplate assembly protein W